MRKDHSALEAKGLAGGGSKISWGVHIFIPSVTGTHPIPMEFPRSRQQYLLESVPTPKMNVLKSADNTGYLNK